MPTALFDIDGTLLDTGGSGRQAMHRTARKLFGAIDFPQVELSGRTDFAIFHDLLNGLGLDPLDHYTVFRQHYHLELEAELERKAGSRSFLLPGVVQLLEELARQGDWELGLVTGNCRRAAMLKLRSAAIGHFFLGGGFGDWHACRTEVAGNAVAELRHAGFHCRPAETVVIGDTPQDVSCARGNGLKVLAVATGWSAREALVATGADAVCDSLDQVTVASLAALLD